MLIQAYQASWARDFARIQAVLHEALAPLWADIQHVGSTAVEDLPAKPILDIDLAYTPEVTFADIKKGLEAAGYYHNGNQGIADREVFKRREQSEKHAVLDFITHHLYVCPAHSAELARHLLFRDYLRTHAEARKQYAQMKYTIAEEAQQNKKVYAELKESKAKGFITNILEQARQTFNKG